jgi:serine/threonine protein kinase/tetratricopeptide (TPR) repeat protein
MGKLLIHSRGAPLQTTMPHDVIGSPAPESASPRPHAVVVGTSVGHYHILARLGAGGMGVVYEAEDLRLSRHVALKFLPEALAQDPVSLSRFEREARLASSLNHPNICTIHDIGTAGGSPYIVMELLEGETLRSRLAAGPLAIDEFLHHARQIVAAVAAAHARQIVHRDLKPANIFLTRSGTSLKVLDFGLAKPVRDTDDEATVVTAPAAAGEPDAAAEALLVTVPGTVLGTTAYMSPEQISGRRVDERTDVFALGIILYEALAGMRPFAGADLDEMRQQILRKTPLPLAAVNAAVPAEIDRLVQRCLEKRPESRFASAVELETTLTTLVGQLTRPTAGTLSSDGAAGRRWTSERIDSVAVLPFECSPTDAESEYLGDGICEDIIRDLSRVPGVRVKARSIVQRYRGQQPAPAAVGTELGVAAVVLGRVSRRGERLTVGAEFVRCDDESLLWGDRFTRGAKDLLAIEEEVLQRIVREITSRLGDGEAAGPAKAHTPNPDAHHLYLRGRTCWNQRTPESLRRAIEYFQRAVEVDPEYGLAFSGLADAYTTLSFYDLVPPGDVMPRAKAAAERALQCDGALPEAHASLGLVASIWDFNWDESGHRLRQALELDASLAYVHHWYAMQLSTLGRSDEAYAEIRRALVLDPLSPAAQSDALNVLIRGRRFDTCVQDARRALALEPRWAAGWAGLGRALQYRGDIAGALEAFQRAVDLNPASVRMRALLAAGNAVAGRIDEARRIREQLASEATGIYVPAFWLAVIAHALGDSEGTLSLLEAATRERYPQIAYLAVEPVFDSLRTHPRFIHLLREIGVHAVVCPTPSAHM